MKTKERNQKQLNKMKQYSEHDKLLEVQEQSQFLGEFLEWCSSEGMFLAKYVSSSDKYGNSSDMAFPVYKSINTLLAEFLKIDLSKLEQEKKDMLRSTYG